MTQSFVPGDDLIFQLESGYGLLRVLAREGEGLDTVWHLMSYEDLFPNVEAAERALNQPESLRAGNAHMPLTDRAFERTPAARVDRSLSGCRSTVAQPHAQPPTTLSPST